MRGLLSDQSQDGNPARKIAAVPRYLLSHRLLPGICQLLSFSDYLLE